MSLIVALAAAWPIGALAATQPRLGTADPFAVLAGQAITSTGPTIINGNVGISPNGGSSVVPGTPPWTVNGQTHYADGVALQAKNDLVTAYNDAAGQTPFNTLSGDLGGRILVPGTYTFSSSALLTGSLTLNGFGVYVFQIASTITTASDSRVVLSSGAQACGVYWQIGSSATFGTRTAFQGTVMALQSITMNTGATLIGRALARNAAVTLDTNTITRPAASCAGLPFTGIPLELRGGFPWQLLLIGVAGALGALVLGSGVRGRRRRTA